jgi:hypothetical protein
VQDSCAVEFADYCGDGFEEMRLVVGVFLVGADCGGRLDMHGLRVEEAHLCRVRRRMGSGSRLEKRRWSARFGLRWMRRKLVRLG